MLKEITIFQPNSRKKEATIQSFMIPQAVDALEERLGSEAAEKAKSSFRTMDRLDIDLLQFRVGERRVRLKTVS